MDNINIWTISSSISTNVMAICAVINVIQDASEARRTMVVMAIILCVVIVILNIVLTISLKKGKNNIEKNNIDSNYNIEKNNIDSNYNIEKNNIDSNSKTKIEKKKDTNIKDDRKMRPEFYIILASLVALSIIQLFLNYDKINNYKREDPVDLKTKQNKEPLLVFAGGGSVKNYLMQSPKFIDKETGKGIEVGIDSNTICIPMASGSAWRVLAEEYHLIDDDSLKKFTTICLSADEMSEEFYTEYISNLKDAIVIKLHLGEDPLVAYISKTVLENWDIDTNFILLDTLASKLQRIIEGKEKTYVYTTNIMSGTLEQYKKSFKNSKSVQGLGSKMIDSIAKKLHVDNIQDTLMKSLLKNSIETRNFFDLEKMIEERQARPYYDKTNIDSINAPFIILGSKYYCIKGLKGSSFNFGELSVVDIIDNKKTTISKPMNLYFLAYKKESNDNEYEVKDHRIIEFLKELESRYPDIVIDRDAWNEMMKNNTVKHHLNNTQKMNKITEIKKQDKK